MISYSLNLWMFDECNGAGAGGGGINWIDLAQVRDRWRALLNAVMNLRVPVEKFLTR